ncbi:arylesterase [Crenobacter caeni]|uniref:Arylesterase n=1 Tax=Crenobacter caeni TaxID=2705474 RepID=A0A6B2KPJ8_9NEIS|nr:arylesterase [Crenobacter caeni]NDV11767.1 arylesterase [Crenobacter caeni]
MLRLFFCLWIALASPWVAAKTVLVFGDSLSAAYGMKTEAGWVALLGQRLAPAHRVVNASVSGETSAGGLARLPATLDRVKPDVLVLELGGNDGLRGLPPAELSRNLSRMVELSKARGIRVLLVGMALPPNYGPDYTARFRAVYDDLAKRARLAYVPVLVAGFETRMDWFQADGIHPTAAAQPTMATTIEKALRPLLK